MEQDPTVPHGFIPQPPLLPNQSGAIQEHDSDLIADAVTEFVDSDEAAAEGAAEGDDDSAND